MISEFVVVTKWDASFVQVHNHPFTYIPFIYIYIYIPIYFTNLINYLIDLYICFLISVAFFKWSVNVTITTDFCFNFPYHMTPSKQGG